MTTPAGRTALVILGFDRLADADPGLVDRVRDTVRLARSVGVKIIYLFDAPGDGTGEAPGDGAGEDRATPPAAGPLVPEPSDLVVGKRGTGGFAGSDLAVALRTADVASLVLAGSPAPGEVESTVRSAADLGWSVTMLSDAVAPWEPPVPPPLADGEPPAATEVISTAEWVAQLPAPRRRRTSRRLVPILALAVVVVVVAGISEVAVHGAHRFYVFSPGTAPALTTSADCRARPSELALADGAPCVRLSVPSSLDHGISGKLFMVDVDVGPATPPEYLLAKLHLLHVIHDGMQLIPAAGVLGGAPANQLGCQDTQEMNGATEDAAVVALRRLGYNVSETDTGAQIDLVEPGSPADRAGIQCNDMVTAVAGTAVRTAEDLSTVIQKHHPGDLVAVTLSSPGASGKVNTRTVTARLVAAPHGAAAAGTAKGFLGVESETRADYTFPFDVSINAGDIGGPSAGLAFTLGLIDLLSAGHLTGGHEVAATGEIALNGDVLDVGGVAQKTVAVRRAGAQVFLVPVEEYHAALSEAGSKLKVYPVATLSQALQDLENLGGTLGTLSHPLPTTTA